MECENIDGAIMMGSADLEIPLLNEFNGCTHDITKAK